LAEEEEEDDEEEDVEVVEAADRGGVGRAVPDWHSDKIWRTFSETPKVGSSDGGTVLRCNCGGEVENRKSNADATARRASLANLSHVTWVAGEGVDIGVDIEAA
jgi:hypothetical protein